MADAVQIGKNTFIDSAATVGLQCKIGNNCIIEKDVSIDDGAYIDSNVIIRSGTKIGKRAFIGANCIIGEYQMDFCVDRKEHEHILEIGNDALIRSGTIIYTGSKIGNHFQTGHRVTVREKSIIGDYVSIGTLSDIQGYCELQDYVRLHSNVHVGQKTTIEKFVWVYPYTVFTNDPTPPSNVLKGAYIKSFAVIATGALIMPGKLIEEDSLVAAGAVVTKDVEKYAVVGGNPARKIADIRDIKDRQTGERKYPWRYTFERGMPWEGIGYDTWAEK